MSGPRLRDSDVATRLPAQDLGRVLGIGQAVT
jgi:hypothetical protein